MNSWRCIKECKSHIFVVIFIFVLSLFIGYFFPYFFVEEIKEFIKNLIERTSGMNALELIIFILFNNLWISFLGLAAGILFGIFPILVAVVNGYIIGFIFQEVVKSSGAFELWRILPHGVFELPAVIVSLGMGLKLGTSLFLEFKKALKLFLNLAKVFVLVVLPLLVVAAIIEGLLIILI